MYPSLYIGLPLKFIRILQSIYSNVYARVRCETGASRPFKIQKGVLQGESLSPSLFCIYINDIVEIMENSKIPGINIMGRVAREIHILLFADDIVLVADNKKDLQKKINLLASYLQENKLIPNISKTKILIFRKAGPLCNSDSFTWEGEKLEIVSSYKYLGVTFKSSGLYNTQVKEAINKSKGALGCIWTIINKGKMRIPQSRFKIFDSLVQSILMYAAPVWSLQHLDDLEIVQQTFIKRLFRLPRNTPHYFTRLETNRVHTKFQVIKNTINY